jgi:hypothetical protein
MSVSAMKACRIYDEVLVGSGCTRSADQLSYVDGTCVIRIGEIGYP